MMTIHLWLNLFVLIGRSPVTGESDNEDVNYPERLFIGGSQVANVKEAPYVVALVRKDENGVFQVPFCTGAIINEAWVLSAAHCAAAGLEFEIVAGCDAVDQLEPSHSRPSRQKRSPIELRKHPLYTSIAAGSVVAKLGDYDVMLIRVERFVFGPAVDRIALSASEWRGRRVSGKDYFDTECTAFGWGAVEAGVPTENLRKANFTAQHGQDACGTCVGYARSLRLICTSPLSGHSVCPGDSGGPLVCHGLLAGVAHTLTKCLTGITTTEPLVCGSDNVFSSWMYVCPMLTWIHKVVPDTPDEPISCQSRSRSRILLPGLTLGISQFLLMLMYSHDFV